jgi:phospholipase C
MEVGFRADVADSLHGSSRPLPWRSLVLCVGVATLVLFPSPTVAIQQAGRTQVASDSLAAFDRHIDHIVIVVLENRAYDNLFGSYCLKLGVYCPNTTRGLTPSLCVPLNPANASAGCVHPYNLTSTDVIYGAFRHTAASSIQAYDNGAMDEFYIAENSGLKPFAHYTATSTATLWDMAEEYALDDNFFSATLSYSLPNHWHLVAGQAPAEVQSHGIEYGQGPPANRSLYLDEANRTKSVEDSLLNSSTSWLWYNSVIGNNYSKAIGSTSPNGTAGRAFSLWNPQAAKAESYNQSFSPHFVDNTQFYGDAAAGRLPNVSWVIPYQNESDHQPASHNVAQDWLASVVDAVEASPDWNSSAIFVTWDDYGGFYDQVAPPLVQGVPLGFRVPLMVIGPYVREGFVSHVRSDLDSLLRLVELRFGLPCFTPDDCNAQVPLGFFNFTQGPRAPLTFGTSAKLVHYPMPLQNVSAAPADVTRPYLPPSAFLQVPYLPDGSPDLGDD